MKKKLKGRVFIMKISVDFSKDTGKVKIMHAVNNGPVGSSVRGNNFCNIKEFKEAGIPYARNHDAAFFTGYGGEHSTDVHRIFPNFDADVNDPASYVFEPTDNCIANMYAADCKPFYRLGAAIEHGYKKGTYPPKDTIKWAQICEHIIMHYTEGWADGFNYDIEYWEIWNEPDCFNADGSNPCWQGTKPEFVEFFTTAFEYLKNRFPRLKIGGPAMMNIRGAEFNKMIFDALMAKNLTLDFFSFHKYGNTPAQFNDSIEAAYKLLCDYGCEDKTELILNEWNYIRSFYGDKWEYSIRAEKGMKGAAFIASVMCVCQASKLDMLMYYDARPCKMNGMFDTDYYRPLKGYYPFVMFNNLYKMGNAVFAEGDCDYVYATAAKGNNGESGVMLSYFCEEDDAVSADALLDIQNGAKTYEMYLLDDEHTNELIGKVNAGDTINLKPQSVVYLKSI